MFLGKHFHLASACASGSRRSLTGSASIQGEALRQDLALVWTDFLVFRQASFQESGSVSFAKFSVRALSLAYRSTIFLEKSFASEPGRACATALSVADSSVLRIQRVFIQDSTIDIHCVWAMDVRAP